jgi:type III pantothenate kinase
MARGIRNGYEDPERLGVDRWLAIIAGYTLSGGAPCCIVDCGSAITIDYVSKGGSHEGGVIAPGLLLMKRALLQDTSEITIQGDADQSAQLVPLGRNTETAVDSGLKFMEAGLIEIALQRYAVKFGEDAELILTGGDAETVNGLIGFESRIIPDLVLDGLALALP